MWAALRDGEACFPIVWADNKCLHKVEWAVDTTRPQLMYNSGRFAFSSTISARGCQIVWHQMVKLRSSSSGFFHRWLFLNSSPFNLIVCVTIPFLGGYSTTPAASSLLNLDKFDLNGGVSRTLAPLMSIAARCVIGQLFRRRRNATKSLAETQPRQRGQNSLYFASIIFQLFC